MDVDTQVVLSEKMTPTWSIYNRDREFNAEEEVIKKLENQIEDSEELGKQ